MSHQILSPSLDSSIPIQIVPGAPKMQKKWGQAIHIIITTILGSIVHCEEKKITLSIRLIIVLNDPPQSRGGGAKTVDCEWKKK